MKLSEALMLGSMSGEKPHNDGDWDCCLLGVACHAIGKKGDWYESIARWPWLNSEVSSPYIAGGLSMPGSALLTAFCGKVERGLWSIQQAADAVAEIEPKEVHASETIREVQSGLGPMRSTPEVETFETITK